MDVKQTLELIAALKELGLLVKAAMKDGKIDLTDLNLLPQLLVKQQVLVDGLTGLGEVVGEVKDLSIDEALLVLKALAEAAKEVRAA